jgi:hypothetical protein
MSENSNISGAIKGPVKNITAEVVGNVVARLTRFATGRAVDELKQRLGDASSAGLREQLAKITEHQINEFAGENTDSVVREIMRENVAREQVSSRIAETIRQPLEKIISKAVKPGSHVVRNLAIGTGIALVIIIPLVIWVLGAGGEEYTPPGDIIVDEDVTPPEVTLYITPREPQPGDRVRFVAESGDENSIDWMELTVNGEIVEEDEASQLSYTGGPYSEGDMVIYSASAYDEAGNRGTSGERSFTIPVLGKPDLVVTDVWHELTNEKDGIYVIHYIVQNRGDGESAPSMTVLDMGRDAREDEIPGLAPGGRIERQFPPVVLSLRGFEVRICSDVLQEVA